MPYVQVYYDGMPPYGSMGLPLRRHGDEMARLAPPLGCAAAGACYCALGRCDDTMNLGGIKVRGLGDTGSRVFCQANDKSRDVLRIQYVKVGLETCQWH